MVSLAYRHIAINAFLLGWITHFGHCDVSIVIIKGIYNLNRKWCSQSKVGEWWKLKSEGVNWFEKNKFSNFYF